MRTYKKTLKELESYKLLESNWDGYDCPKPIIPNIDKAINFLNLLEKNKFQAPTPMIAGDGEVGLYWTTPRDVKDSYYIEISFDTDEGYCFFYEFEKNSEKHELYGKEILDISIIEDKLFEKLKLISEGS